MTSAQQPSRWEHGSEFHAAPVEATTAEVMPWDRAGILLGCGRDALRFVLEHVRDTRGVRRLWVPSYFCQEVVESMKSARLEILAYAHAPTFEPAAVLPTHAGDLLLAHNPLGLQRGPSPIAFDGPPPIVLEDHTHDPWSDWARESRADYAIASLRKTLPIPLGAVAWSPIGHALPAAPPVTPERVRASDAKLAAMTLKAAYLAGGTIEKPRFRQLAIEGEQCVASGDVSGAPAVVGALLDTMPIRAWRERRRENHAALVAALAGVSWLTIAAHEEGARPFSGLVVVDTPARRERVREALVRGAIYPAVLWTLDEPAIRGIPAEHVEFARRTLSIHCDMRYSAADMVRVAERIIVAGEAS